MYRKLAKNVLTYLGPDGTPVEIQYLGELSKVQQAVLFNNAGKPYPYQDPEIQACLSDKLVLLVILRRARNT
jgi:hypothetical protein